MTDAIGQCSGWCKAVENACCIKLVLGCRYVVYVIYDFYACYSL